MRKMRILAIILLCLALIGIMPTAASAELYPEHLACVNDVDDLLTDEQEQEINVALGNARDSAGIPICAYVFYSEISSEGYMKYRGEDFLAEYNISKNSPLVLLVVTVTVMEVYYDIYTYGDAYYKINEKEIGYILDDSRVYDNIKRGKITEGLCAYAELSAQAYAGRLGVSWRLILIVALIIGGVVATLCVKSIAARYKRKNPSTSYPLDRFATLDLTRSHDHVLGKFVTTTIISSGSRGGRGGGGGMGGGGGHRGGR